jgi:hypothetical protein
VKSFPVFQGTSLLRLDLTQSAHDVVGRRRHERGAPHFGILGLELFALITGVRRLSHRNLQHPGERRAHRIISSLVENE